MKIKLHASAKKDLIEGFHFYENQQKSIGYYFLDSLYSDLESLTITAGIHQIYYKIYFRMLSKRFPFAIYYKITDKIINVTAILDCRRKPAWIRNRLGVIK
ncbi:MAG TPA: type II toxin-antitoxin system RelE/ParE family toxin [Oceanospirillales bacterium]|nr:type II toxin-antitoxin system RelE/ParE family toxin [Oceanospirillales bacterium]